MVKTGVTVQEEDLRSAKRPRINVSDDDVVAILGVLDDGGIEAWVDGGWAVDALMGEQTRPHADLDLAVRTSQFASARACLADAGFLLVRDDAAHNVVLGDDLGRLVDLHSFDQRVEVVGEDGLIRAGGDGLAYELHGFGGRGFIAGVSVPCISADTLVRYHTGYAVDDDDWHDVRLLCERFLIEIPSCYEPFLSPYRHPTS